MRIFSNFDTKFLDKVLASKIEQFGEEKVFIIQRSKYYLIFRVLFHLFLYILLLVGLLLFLLYIGVSKYIFLIVSIVWFLVIWFRIIHRFLKYLYDFTVVTPVGIITYKQKGILHSITKEIPSRRIEAIEVCRTNLLGNVFGYGNIDIVANIAENAHLGQDNEAPWVVGLTFVDKPYKAKDKISRICFQ